MRTRCTTASLVALLGIFFAGVWTCCALDTGILWDDLSDRKVTSLGRSVLKTGGSSWSHAEGSNLVFHATAPELIASLGPVGEFLDRRMTLYLGAGQGKRKSHVFLVGDDALWNEAIRGGDRRKDSLGVQFRTDLFLLIRLDSAAMVYALSHEMAHFRLWQRYGNDVPLWLDEGVASYAGWEAAQDYMLSVGKDLYRDRPSVGVERFMTVDALTAAENYPQDEVAFRAFCRQSEELIYVIARKIGKDRLADFIDAVAEDELSWKEALQTRFGCDESVFADLENELMVRLQAENEHD